MYEHACLKYYQYAHELPGFDKFGEDEKTSILKGYFCFILLTTIPAYGAFTLHETETVTGTTTGNNGHCICPVPCTCPVPIQCERAVTP